MKGARHEQERQRQAWFPRGEVQQWLSKRIANVVDIHGLMGAVAREIVADCGPAEARMIA
jgi:hypothetical protein